MNQRVPSAALATAILLLMKRQAKIHAEDELREKRKQRIVIPPVISKKSGVGKKQ